MAVDLQDLIDPLRREVNPPGSDLFPDAIDDDFLGALTDAFWELRVHGYLTGFEENAAARGGPAEFSEAIVTPTGETDPDYDEPSGYDTDSDMGRDLQQLVVLWAGWKITLNRMGALQSVFRAKAGPVEYETQQAATLLRSVLDQLKLRIDAALDGLDAGSDTTVFDAVIERSYAMAAGSTWWVTS